MIGVAVNFELWCVDLLLEEGCQLSGLVLVFFCCEWVRVVGLLTLKRTTVKLKYAC